MATAIRGAELALDDSVRGDFTREVEAETNWLPCNFFIRPQYTLPLRLWLFPEPCTIFPIVSGAYQTKTSVEEERAEICHRTRYSKRRGYNAGTSHRHLAKVLQRVEQSSTTDRLAAALCPTGRLPCQPRVRSKAGHRSHFGGSVSSTSPGRRPPPEFAR